MPFDPSAISSPFRMQPGLFRLAPEQRQLTPNRPGDALLDAKLAVLRAQPSQALCKLADWDDRPALAALLTQARLDAPEAWSTNPTADGQDEHSAKLLGWSIRGDQLDGDGPPAIGECLRTLPAQWRLAGLLSLAFAEDLAVIEVVAGTGSRIPWLAVCLPSHWAPEARLGQSFAEVHAPVADNRLLLRAADPLVQLVTGGERWQRFVWTVTPSGRLDGHPQRQSAVNWPDEADAQQIGRLAWLRTEHQTFIPVAGRPQAVFTILVELRRLGEVLADPLSGRQIGQALHAAIASMSPAVLGYRRLGSARDRLLAWLAAQHRGCRNE